MESCAAPSIFMDRVTSQGFVFCLSTFCFGDIREVRLK